VIHQVHQKDSQVKLGTSELIGSVEFRQFLYYRIPVRISSDKFRSVPIGFVNFQRIPVEIFQNLPEFFRRNPGRNPVVRKSSEFNGADRKSTKYIGFVVGKQRKQSVPAVGTVDLGYHLHHHHLIQNNNFLILYHRQITLIQIMRIF
jgi:hypothetical protein